MQRMPKMSHQICGASCRQVSTEVYSRMCAVRNQLRVRRETRVFILKQAKSVTIVQIKRRRCEVATLTRTGKWRRYGRCGMNSPSEKPSIRQWRGLGRSRGLRRGSLRRVSDARRPWLMGQWRLEGCEGHVRSAFLIGAKMPGEGSSGTILASEIKTTHCALSRVHPQ